MEKNKTAVEWLFEELNIWQTIADEDTNATLDTVRKLLEQAKQMEKDQIIEHLIGFQIYLNNKGLITNHDWDFEKLPKQYIKKEYK